MQLPRLRLHVGRRMELRLDGDPGRRLVLRDQSAAIAPAAPQAAARHAAAKSAGPAQPTATAQPTETTAAAEHSAAAAILAATTSLSASVAVACAAVRLGDRDERLQWPVEGYLRDERGRMPLQLLRRSRVPRVPVDGADRGRGLLWPCVPAWRPRRSLHRRSNQRHLRQRAQDLDALIRRRRGPLQCEHKLPHLECKASVDGCGDANSRVEHLRVLRRFLHLVLPPPPP